MLFALRYDENQQLAGAALACDVTSQGDAFWQDVYAAPVSRHPDCQTAFVMVRDTEMQRRLLSLEHDDTDIVHCDDILQQMIEEPSLWNRAA